MAVYRSYQKEVKLAIASIISVFNNITISRYNKDNTVKKDLKVPVVYAGVNQIIKSILSKNKVQPLPIITVEYKSIERDIDRVVDLNKPFLYQNRLYSEAQIQNKHLNDAQRLDRKLSYDFRRNPPQPVNISFEVTFITQYEEDLWQLISNVAPFISPYVIVSSYHPYDSLEIIRSKIICDGNFNTDIPVEQDIESMNIYKASLSLTYMGYIWFGNDKDKFSWTPPTVIKNIISGASNGPVGNTEFDTPEKYQYVDDETGDIYNGIDTGKNVNDGDEPGDNEFVDEDTGIIYRKDYHFAEGNIKDGFFITAPGQSIKEVEKLIDYANTHGELPYHEHLST